MAGMPGVLLDHVDKQVSRGHGAITVRHFAAQAVLGQGIEPFVSPAGWRPAPRTTQSHGGPPGKNRLGEVLVEGVADGSRPVRGAGLGEDPVDVALDRVGAEVELGGDAGVGHAPCHHRQDFCFSSGEAVG